MRGRRGQGLWPVWRQSLGVLLAVASISLAAAAVTYGSLREVEQRRLDVLVTRLVQDVEQVVSTHTGVLYGLRSLSLASGPLSRAGFSDYVDEGRLLELYPGAQAFELITRVPAEGVAAFEERVRSDVSVAPGGYPGFGVTPESDATERWVVDYVEPFEANRAAFGYDISADGDRRDALFSARDQGLPRATAPLHLVQETADQRGVLILLPLYDGSVLPESVYERRQSCVGMVLVVYRAGDMLERVSELNPELAFTVADTTDPQGSVGEAALSPGSGGGASATAGTTASGPAAGVDLYSSGELAGPTEQADLEVHGRRWRITASPQSVDGWSPLAVSGTVAGVGLALALVVATFVSHLAATQRRAIARARVLQASDDQRRTLERNLHDGAQQRLLAVSLTLSRALERVRGDPPTAALVAEAATEVTASLSELRDLAHGIHPAVLSDHGLEVALQAVAARAAVPVVLDVATVGRLPQPVEVAAYYLVSEALANIGKHASALTASVTIEHAERVLRVEVRDDGRGGATFAPGGGLSGLADRVAALDGDLELDSPAGSGTRLVAVIPCG